MKLLLSADLHGVPIEAGWLDGLPQDHGYELVILAGDLLDLFNADSAAGQAVWMESWLREISARIGHIVVCSGNHDVDGPNGADWLRELGQSNNQPPIPERSGGLTVDGQHAVFSELVVSVCPYWNILDWGEAHQQRLQDQAEQVWAEGRRLARAFQLKV